VVDLIEFSWSGLSYAVVTVIFLYVRWPVTSLTLLAGADAAVALDGCRDIQRIRSLARMAVLRRGHQHFAFPAGITGQVLDTRQVDVSSTEIRQRIRSGASIHGFVPESVAAYVASAGLYR